MTELADMLELLYGARDHTPALEGEVVRRKHRAGDAARAAQMAKTLPNRPVRATSAKASVAESRFELLTAPGNRWRVRDVAAGSLRVCDGRRVWRQQGDIVSVERPFSYNNPVRNLIDPSFLLPDRRFLETGPRDWIGRAGISVKAEHRPRLVDVARGSDATDTESFIVDLEWGLLLRYEHFTEGVLLQEEQFTRLSPVSHVDDSAFLFEPPPSSVVLDQSERAELNQAPSIGVRLSLVTISLVQAWQALRGDVHPMEGTGLPPQYFPRSRQGR